MNRKIPEREAEVIRLQGLIAEIKGTESVYRELLAASPYGILVHDSEGKILLFNSRLEQITGFAASEIPDIATWLRLIHPNEECRKVMLEEQHHEAPPGSIRVREAMITRRDSRADMCRFTSVQMESGLRIVFVQPVADSKEKHFQELVDMLPETVCEVDADGRITFLNRSGFERFGIKPADLERGLSPADLLLPEDRQRVMENIRRVLRGEKPVPPSEYTAVCKDGRLLPYVVLSRPVVKEGKIVGLTALIIDITERKGLEAALQDNEERLRLAVEAARVGIHATDLETGSIQWSPELYAITGLQPGTIKTNKEAWSVVHPDDRARAMDIHHRALDPAGKGLFYSEHRIVRPDGEARWIAWRGRTFFRDTPSGKVPTRRLGACVDITKRKLAEIALQLSEKKFSKLFEASPHGLAITTFDEGRYLEANPTESFLTGYSREELIGRTALELGFYCNPEDSQNIRRLLAENGSVNNYKFRYRRKSGEIQWGLLSANLIEFEGKKCLLSTVSDITELRKGEEAFKLSEERLRMATEGATVGWWDWDLRSGSVVCNDIYYTMLGYSPQEFPLSFESWKELVFPDDIGAAVRDLDQALAGNLPTFVAEYRMKCKDASWRWIQDLGRVSERDANGKAERAIGIHIDIHDRKISEENLFKANQDLEERVRGRTAALEDLNVSLRREISARSAVEEELRARTEELAEINSALRVVLRKSREEGEENTRKTASYIRQLAFPHLEKLKLARLTGRQAAYVQLLDEALSQITSQDVSSLSDLQRKLTASEFQVAAFISQGKTSKQISEIVLLSCRTIESHRKSIRKKLGLQHSKTNLRSHLASIGNKID